MQGYLQLQSSVQLFDIAFAIKSLVFVVHLLNAFWHGNETFPKGSSEREIVPLLSLFHLPYSKYKVVKICFYLCCYQNQNISLVLYSRRSCSTRIALVSHSCRLCLTRVALVLHSCHSCRTRVARVWDSCCKLDYIF